jgi:hypothetical protein
LGNMRLESQSVANILGFLCSTNSMKRSIRLTVLLIMLISLIFIVRGVPENNIPYPELQQTDTLRGFSGRPIPYNEVLLAYRSWFNFKVIIYNDLNNVLSDNEFRALDFDAIKKSTGATLVIPNGYRYWVLDKIEGTKIAPRRTLNNHEFLVPGFVTISVLDAISRKPYKPKTVNRDTIYTYFANTKVYRLIDPSGKVYTMQSATRAIDSNQTIDQLDQLGSKLSLPSGWSFRIDVLEKDLILPSYGQTQIIQDEFQNTYQHSL